MPTDLATNRTGLYANGHWTALACRYPSPISSYACNHCHGGKVLKPKIAYLTAGKQPSREGIVKLVVLNLRITRPFQPLGFDFPLFTAAEPKGPADIVKTVPTEIIREISFPIAYEIFLLKGLHAAVQRTHQESIGSLARIYRQYPEATRQFYHAQKSTSR